MTTILGLSAFYHDSAAALVIDGEIVAAAAEERFTRNKHDATFPIHAIRFCLEEAQLTPDQLDFVGFYEKPLVKFDRLLETYLAFAPSGYQSFRSAMPTWLTTKLRLPKIVRRELQNEFGHSFDKRIVFCEHHQSHAASAFFPSPFDEAAILTIDGVGEWTTASVAVGRGNTIEMKQEVRFPHSIGLLYSAFTNLLGFEINEGEYKLMGLAAHGKPVYRDLILEKLIDLKSDGSFQLDMTYFNYCQGLTMTSSHFAKLFDTAARAPEAEITQQHKDIAASIQAVTEEVLLQMVRHIHQETELPNLVLAGGVALNCVANGRIHREGLFDGMWVQPAAGDDGGALGVAMLIWNQLLNNKRTPRPQDSQRGSLLGPSFDDQSICQLLDKHQVRYETAVDDVELCAITASALAEKKTVGWFQGAMEYGPRALGNRSILGDARDPEMQQQLNTAIKNRESFRPFAPAVLAEKAHEYFQIDQQDSSPYMLLVTNVKSTANLPAVTHLDGSARIQTVGRDRFPLFHQLLTQFDQLTDCPVLVNTSFNVRGEPIVCSPQEAYRCFMNTDLDLLVMGRQVIRKDSLVKQKNDQKSEGMDAIDAPLTRKQHRWINIEVPWKPTTSELNRFSLVLALTVPILVWLFLGAWELICISTIVAIFVVVAARMLPAVTLVIYRVLLVIVLPLMLFISEVSLASIYYLVLTPIAWLLRAAGRSEISLNLDKSVSSYWQDRISKRDTNSYYRQS